MIDTDRQSTENQAEGKGVIKFWWKWMKQIFGGFPLVTLVVIILCVGTLSALECCLCCDPTIKQIIKEVAIAVLASDLFIIAINLQRPLVVNDTIVIRRRESQIGNPASISLLVGCPGYKWLGSIYDVKCTFIYHIDDGAGSNSAFTQTYYRDCIDHHFRFSFEIENKEENKWVKRFWEDYLNNSPNNNRLFVVITGSSNRLGGKFCYKQEYQMEQLMIGEDCFGVLKKEKGTKVDIKKGTVKKEFNGLENKRNGYYWTEFTRCTKHNEAKEAEIRKKIKEALGIPLCQGDGSLG